MIRDTIKQETIAAMKGGNKERTAALRLIQAKIKDRDIELRTAKGDRGYEAELLGRIETKGGKVTRLDVVAKGEFWGEGTYTRRAPKGRFPLAIAFTLADGKDAADTIPPQGSRGWVRGYIR